MVQRSQGVFTNMDSTLQYFKFQFFISDGQVGGPPVAPSLLQATARNTSKIPSAELRIEQELETTHLACQAHNKSLSAGVKMRERFQIRSIGNTSENTSVFWHANIGL